MKVCPWKYKHNSLCEWHLPADKASVCIFIKADSSGQGCLLCLLYGLTFLCPFKGGKKKKSMLLYCGTQSTHRVVSALQKGSTKWGGPCENIWMRSIHCSNKINKKSPNSSFCVQTLVESACFGLLIYKAWVLIITCQLQLWNKPFSTVIFKEIWFGCPMVVQRSHCIHWATVEETSW